MPSPDTIPSASDGYLRRVLRQGSMPFCYRGGVRTLLGMPASGEDAVVGAAGMPPIEFRYAVSPSLATMTAPDSLAADRWVEAALNDLDSEEWTGLKHSPVRSRQPPAIGTSSPSHQVGAEGGGYNPESGIDRVPRNPSTLRAGAGGAALPPRSGHGTPALASRAALPQMTPVNAVPLPNLVSQAGEPPSENLSTTRVDAVGAAPPPQSEQPCRSGIGRARQTLQLGELSGHAGHYRARPVPDLRVLASPTLEPGQLQRVSPETDPAHPTATEALVPSQVTAPVPEEPLAAASGAAGQPTTTITVPGISEPRPSLSSELSAIREYSPRDQASVVLPPAIGVSSPSHQVGADGVGYDPESGMDSAQRNPSTTRVGAVGAASPPRSEQVPSRTGVIVGNAAAGAAPPPRPDPTPPPRSGQALPAIAPRTALLQVAPDDPPGVGVSTSAYPSASSAAEQIARLRHVVSELAAQVAAQQDFQQQPTPLFPPPVQPVVNIERPAPRPGTSHAFWERSYINRLYRWSRR